MESEFRTEYQRLNDPRWFFAETGTEENCRKEANRLWAFETTNAVRIVKWTPEVVAQKRRSQT